ncbi:hypothetical protein D3C72_213580 [compost metagenome]
MKNYFPLVLALMLSACALPETAVKTGSLRPTLIVKGAPVGSILVVDGLVMGQAEQFNGAPNELILEEGLHQVEIKQGSVTVHAEKTVISNGESRTVNVNAGAR